MRHETCDWHETCDMRHVVAWDIRVMHVVAWDIRMMHVVAWDIRVMHIAAWDMRVKHGMLCGGMRHACCMEENILTWKSGERILSDVGCTELIIRGLSGCNPWTVWIIIRGLSGSSVDCLDADVGMHRVNHPWTVWMQLSVDCLDAIGTVAWEGNSKLDKKDFKLSPRIKLVVL